MDEQTVIEVAKARGVRRDPRNASEVADYVTEFGGYLRLSVPYMRKFLAKIQSKRGAATVQEKRRLAEIMAETARLESEVRAIERRIRHGR